MILPFMGENAARSKQTLRLVQYAQRLLMGTANLVRGSETRSQVRPQDGQVEQIGLDFSFRGRVAKTACDQVALLPDPATGLGNKASLVRLGGN